MVAGVAMPFGRRSRLAAPDGGAGPGPDPRV